LSLRSFRAVGRGIWSAKRFNRLDGEAFDAVCKTPTAHRDVSGRKVSAAGSEPVKDSRVNPINRAIVPSLRKHADFGFNSTGQSKITNPKSKIDLPAGVFLPLPNESCLY
jgi:hypothetical protein